MIPIRRRLVRLARGGRDCGLRAATDRLEELAVLRDESATPADIQSADDTPQDQSSASDDGSDDALTESGRPRRRRRRRGRRRR